MELFDTHCHLFLPPLSSQIEAVLERARAAGVSEIVVPAYDLASWQAVRQLAGRPGVHAALGLHPWVAAEPLDAPALRQALLESRAVAIGEIGLDFLAEADRDRQLEVLRAQLDLALELDLPVLLHCRKAFEELITMLAPHAGRLRGVVHAFSRGPELAGRLLELGLHLAFGGGITRPRAQRAQRSVAVVPADRLLLETDAPSIGLEGIPPAAVEPCHVAQVAEHCAALRGQPLAELARLTTDNARRLFRR